MKKCWLSGVAVVLLGGLLIGCGGPQEPVRALQGRVLSCWDGIRAIDVLDADGLVWHLDVTTTSATGAPTCGTFREGGIWEISYRPVSFGYTEILSVRRLAQ